MNASLDRSRSLVDLLRNRALPLGLDLPVIADEGMSGVFARHQGATGRSAYRIAGIVPGKGHPFFGQLVQAGCLYSFLSVTTKLGVT